MTAATKLLTCCVLLSITMQTLGTPMPPLDQKTAFLMPTLSPLSSIPSLVPNSPPSTTIPASTSPSIPRLEITLEDSGHEENHLPIIHWSILFPLLAISAVAWTWRKSTRRCLVCILPTDCDDATIPGEIVIEQQQQQRDDSVQSVVGDRDTDVELVPVHTWRSHDWDEVGQDPMQGVFRARGDYLDGYSEALADFALMKDN